MYLSVAGLNENFLIFIPFFYYLYHQDRTVQDEIRGTCKSQ